MAKQPTTDKTTDVSRRKFLGAGTAVAATFGAITLNAPEARAQTFDLEYDVVVCGGGGAGLPTALFSRWLGNKLLVLEKAATRLPCRVSFSRRESRRRFKASFGIRTCSISG